MITPIKFLSVLMLGSLVSASASAQELYTVPTDILTPFIDSITYGF